MQLNHLWRQKRHKRFLAALFAGIIALSCTTGFLQADDEAKKSPVQRSIVKQLRYIDADKAKQYLLDLGIGTDINKLGTMNALIITTYNSRDRMKASSLISLIDSKLKYDLIKVKVDLVPEKIEDVSKISEKIDGIVIGTFFDPPVSNDKPMAIIDVHNSNIIAVVPKGFALPVVAVLEDMFSANTATGDKHETVMPDAETPTTLPGLEAEKDVTTEIENTKKTPAKDDFIVTELMKILATAEQEAVAKTTTKKETVAKPPVRETPAPEKEKIAAETSPVNPTPATPVIKANIPTPAKIAATVKAAATNRRPASITPPAAAPVKSPTYTRDASTNTGFSTAQLEMSDAELDTVIALPTKVLVIDLLKLVGEQLGLNYMYDPLKIKATDSVTLYINDGKIKVRELYSLMESVLKFKGFVMTKRGNFVTIVPMAEMANIDPAIILPGSKLKTGDVVVTQIFQLEHIDTKTAQTMLKSMSLGISMQTIPEMKTLIITGYAFRMPRIRDVLSLVDQPGKRREFQFRSLQYMIAANLLPKIQLLAKELGTVSIYISAVASVSPPASTKRLTTAQRAAAARSAAARSAGAKATTIGAGAAKTGVYLGIDERTNRIMIIGLLEDVEIVNGLIDSLDVPQAGLKYVHQYKIVHVEATHIIDILSELGVTVGGARRSNVAVPTKPGARPALATISRGTSNPNAPQVSLLTESNSLLVNATPEQHERIMMVISYVDVPKQDARVIREYEIENVGTSDILNTLAELEIISSVAGASSPTRRTSSTGRSATSRAASSSGQASATADPVSGEPMISVLGSANSLLIKATPVQHAEIARIIAHVDRELTEVGLPYVIYALTSQEAPDLKGILDEIINVKFSTTTSTSSSPKKSGTPAIPQKITSTSAPSQGVSEKDRIEIVADIPTNSLIVYASKANQMWIGSLIEELDQYRPQVLLDVTLVEITKDDLFNLDLDIVSKYGGLRPGTSMESGGLVSAFLDPFPANKIFEGRVTEGLGSAFYADSHIQALFDLMDQKKYGRVLARPSLLVKDNETGIIDTKKTIYIAEEKSNTTYTGTGSGNQNTTTDVTFQPYYSGITLEITPLISSAKLLQLSIILKRKDFIEGASTVTIRGETVPKPFNETESSITTSAILPDGATIILGGIETISQNKGVTKIPILGDIPFIGFLFRGVDESDRQSKLYVFVKAHIISPGDELTGNSDIELISQKKRKAFEDSEKSFQSLQAMPGIKPNPMLPERILEDDDYLEKIRAKHLIGSTTTVEVVLPK